MKREIPKKNYIVVAIMALTVMVLVFYLARLYTNVISNKENSLLSDYLFNVTLEEFDNYILENPDAVIYWDNNENLNNEKFEKKLKKYIIKHDLQKFFVFVNVRDVSTKEIESISKKYLSEKIRNANLKTMPTLLIIKEGKIVEVIYTQEQNIEYIKEKFQSYGVVE